MWSDALSQTSIYDLDENGEGRIAYPEIDGFLVVYSRNTVVY